MQKTNLHQRLLLILPGIILVIAFFAFRSNNDNSSTQSEEASEFLVDPALQIYYNNVSLFEDASKILVHLVWAHNNASPYVKYTLEKSINGQPFTTIAEKATDKLMDISALGHGSYNPYHALLYSSEDNGGFIYNEIYDKGEFPHIDIKYRLKAERTDGNIVYSPSIGNQPRQNTGPGGNVVATSTHSSSRGLRAPCPSVGAVPKGYTKISGTTLTLACDCGTYTTDDYQEPCTADAPAGCASDCGAACGCAYDPCCQHNCAQYSSCNCVKSKWTACQTISIVTIVTSVNTSCTAPGLTTLVTNTCGCTGGVDLTVTPGSCLNTNYSYNWSNKSTTQDLNNVCPGSYSVTVTDGCGKTAATSATVKSTATAPTLSTSVTNAGCTCGGAVDLTVSGGTPGYSYSWSNKATSQDISGLCAGSYTVTVTDACSMTATTSATVTGCTPPTATTGITNTTGCGSCTGAIDLTPKAGSCASKTFTYSWSNKATSQDLSSLCAGSYTVTITDANGCTASVSATVGTSGSLPTLSTTITNTGCAGCTGAVDLTVTGGTASFSYNWSNGSKSQDLGSLCAGSYTVTVTDAASCTATTTATVGTTGSAPTLSTIVADCIAGCDGSINLSVSGGTKGYSYSWSTKATTQDLSGLCGGTYSVTVTDAASCTATTSASLSCILPVELMNFIAVKKDKVVVISWTTASETNNDYFTVERSLDGNFFYSIKTVDGAGISNQVRHYQHIDIGPLEGTSYYRLMQTDFSGNNGYSDVVKISMVPKDIFIVHPTLANEKVKISFYGENENIEIFMTDVTGKQLFKRNFDNISGIHKYDEDLNSYPKGIYYISMKSRQGVSVRKIMKY